ncbi:hypothetical protein D3C72_2414680 [compost metagenome]
MHGARIDFFQLDAAACDESFFQRKCPFDDDGESFYELAELQPFLLRDIVVGQLLVEA